MRKVQFLAVGWTLALAIPFTVLALMASAYFTEHMTDIANTLTGVINWSGVAIEGSARWPELAGMIVGQILIMTILLIARRGDKAEAAAST